MWKALLKKYWSKSEGFLFNETFFSSTNVSVLGDNYTHWNLGEQGSISFFHNEEQFVFKNKEKIPVITMKRPRKVVHLQVDEIFL